MTIEELARNMIARMYEIDCEYNETLYGEQPSSDRNMRLAADQAFVALHNAIIDKEVQPALAFGGTEPGKAIVADLRAGAVRGFMPRTSIDSPSWRYADRPAGHRAYRMARGCSTTSCTRSPHGALNLVLLPPPLCRNAFTPTAPRRGSLLPPCGIENGVQLDASSLGPNIASRS